MVRLATAAVATCGTLVVLAGVGEWAVRHRERTRTTVPGTMSQLFYRQRRLMHGLVRGMDYYGWVHISPQGFRGTRVVSQLPPDSVIRVITVGGSTTFDGNVSGDDRTWSVQLEEALNASAGPGRYQVLNAGVPGFQILDDLVRLEEELHWYQPTIIVLLQGHNDLFNTLSAPALLPGDARDSRPDEVPAVYPWVRWLERHSLLYHKLGSRLQAIRFRSSGAEEQAQTSEADFARRLAIGEERFARHVRAYLAVAQSLGIQVVVPQAVYVGGPARSGEVVDTIAGARWARAIPFAPLEVVWRGYVAYDSVLRAATSDFGALYVPSSDATLWSLDGFAEGDPVHFNDRGARRFGQALAAAVLGDSALGRATAVVPADRPTAARGRDD